MSLEGFEREGVPSDTFNIGFGCRMETRVSGTGSEAGRRARGCRRDPDEKQLCVAAAAGKMS